MYPLKQSTSFNGILFAHDVNGDAVTGKVDGDWTKRISKNAGAFAAMTVTVTEMEAGFYSFTLSSSHTDTLDLLTVRFSASGVKQVNLMWRVLAKTTDDLMSTYTQPTGFLAATFPSGTVANTTNITAGTITTVTTATNLTNLPSIPANWLTAAGINAAALNGKGDWNINKTGYSLAASAIGATEIAASGANKIADHVLRRTYANARLSSDGDAVLFRSLLGAVGKLVNKWSISGSTLTVYQDDDTSSTAPGGTQAITGTPGADPITALDTT